MKLTKSQREALQKSFLFRSVPPADCETFMERHEATYFTRGEIIYAQEHFQKSLGILLEGEAAVQKESGTLLNILKVGSCFGVAALFAEAEKYVTTITARKNCSVLFISNEELVDLFRTYPDMALDYIAFLSGRIQFLNQKIDSFTSARTEDAVWNWLLTHADDTDKVMVVGGFARLARELNMGRASLYRSLTQLEEAGRIKKEGAEIQLLR